MAEVEDMLQRVERAIADGKVWRAKEILRGNIGTGEYCPQLYERYGQLLLELGEQLEASKYLFLSSARDAAYEPAISLYLSRHVKDTPRELTASFPKHARLPKMADYPEPLQSELRERGVKAIRPARVETSRTASGALGAGCTLVFLLPGALCVIGLIAVIKWIGGQ